MSDMRGVGVQFEESMSGFLAKGMNDPREGAATGRRRESEISFDVRISVGDMGEFLSISDHVAALHGTVTCTPIGGPFPIRDGVFNLFSLDPATGMRQMVYRFRFTDDAGQTYYFHGHKEIEDHPGVDVAEDMTRLFVTIHQGDDDRAPVYGAGEMYFHLSDLPSMVASAGVTGATSLFQKLKALTAFVSFAYGNVRETYLADILLSYDTRYENLLLAGCLDGDDGQRPFFLVSGKHDKGFPWGDGETFHDILLAVGDGNGGYRRYCMSDRVLSGLELDVARGTYSYRGPLLAIEQGYAASFSEMRSGSAHLLACRADIEIAFDARRHRTAVFPFPKIGTLFRKLTGPLLEELRKMFPSENPLGVHITPHTVRVRSGRLTITPPAGQGAGGRAGRQWTINTDRSHGEAESSTFRNLREPTLLYGYICAIRPDDQAARVQIQSRTLRDEREHWLKDQLDAVVGSIYERTASGEILMEDGRCRIRRFRHRKKEEEISGLFVKLGDPVVEVNNNHYPTGVFQRRIIKVRDPGGKECLALEEDVDLMRLEPVNSNEEATVASIRDENKLDALDRVLAETDFDGVLERARQASGKSRADFSIVIKANFMFAYNKLDRSTFTDPELVGHLVKHLKDGLHFENIAVVEAQSTYGEYFDRRSVGEVAEYLGYDTAVDCPIIDMTEDAEQMQNLGPHLGSHPVSAAWRDADFRISFAKNKTHAYAYYTLTLKNIYGALPLANKFKEYHCDRDIYHTTLEYLTAFPVHFGVIDACLSADGPFGIFADVCPNPTHTVIGGANLVAVDWVGATKMGIDPMISQYMRLAVNAFGKPRIRLIGDPNPYRPWLNVPVALTLFTHEGLDASHYFGNVFYAACAQMDQTHFRHKTRSPFIRVLRALSNPLRKLFFVQTAYRPTWLNVLVNRALYRLGC